MKIKVKTKQNGKQTKIQIKKNCIQKEIELKRK